MAPEGSLACSQGPAMFRKLQVFNLNEVVLCLTKHHAMKARLLLKHHAVKIFRGFLTWSPKKMLCHSIYVLKEDATFRTINLISSMERVKYFMLYPYVWHVNM